MVIAGIDEAGYGPILGPLVIGAAAIRTPGDAGGDLPDLWQRLNRHVSAKKTSGKKLHVNDSKLVYTPSAGIKELERAILIFLLAAENLLSAPSERPLSLDDLLHATAPKLAGDLARCPWYLPQPDESFPLANDLLALRLFANAFRQEMHQSQTHLVYLRAHVFLEEPLNRLMEATRNKSNTSFSAVASHIDALMRQFAAEGLVIYCDRQGGRSHYGRVLRTLFEDCALQIVSEADACSEYQLIRNNQTVRLLFSEKAEKKAMSVALASMLAKYLRESLMHRYNVWWTQQVPGLTPTAGYWVDGTRFLQDIAARRAQLGIPDHRLIRSR